MHIVCSSTDMKPRPEHVAIEYWLASLLMLGALVYGIACGVASL
jgi:hypothetical protein